ncbi:MAG TPA: DegV family protein [Thermoanaerobaculia bacterium]|jgi:DegV family protein with EDD domain|nr:DegV family protein [Thermoanaerobaculia bacterium]
MARPSVLVVDPETSRRREIAHGLTGFGYEVIPAVGAAEGRRFAAGLGPGIVVLPAGLARNPAGAVVDVDLFPSPDPAHPRTLLLLGEGEEDGSELPEEVLFLKANGLAPADLVRRIHLVLLGREIGVEPDADLESLVGDLALLPILELLRAANRVRLTGRILCGEGELALADGEVIAATAGRARGLKAFLRLSTLSAGPFWVQLRPSAGGAAVEREIRQDLKSLIFQALEDRVFDAPDPRARARVELGPAFFETRFTPSQQELLAVLPNCVTVGRLLDALPATDNAILRDLLGLRELGIITLEEPEELVGVVTDSTSDLPPEVARVHGIHVVPVLVLFGDRVYHDGVDLKAKEFYELLEKGPLVPRTNPVPEADFQDAYRALAPKKDLISVHISERLSQTVVHARKAAEEGLPHYQELRGEAEKVAIKVVDSRSASLGLGMLALFAARMARRGVKPDAVVERLEAMRERIHVLFVVDTLEYLARSGRIGKARALMGNLLGIKPILGVVDGEIVAVDRVRGSRAAHPKLVDLFKERVDPKRPVVVTVAHAKAPVWADRLRGLIEKSLTVEEVIIAEMGPVVVANAGPGTVGAAVFQPTEEEMELIAAPGNAGVSAGL